MLVLAIETSGLEGSVALARDGVCLTEKQLNQVGRRHAQALVLEIGELLRLNGLTPFDINLVAVSRGPGSFTGLRVGMVCAKTFAYATGCQFIAIDTFSAIAENVPSDVRRVCVIENAQRDDLFAGEYRRTASGEWQLESPIRIISTSEFLQIRADTDVVTGPGISKLNSTAVSQNWLHDTAICQPRAAVIAEIGRRQSIWGIDRLPSNDTDYWLASPFYLRLSAAEEKRSHMEKVADDDPNSPKKC